MTNRLNDYTLIRTIDESAEPDTWRDKQGRKLQAADMLRIHQAQRAWLRDRLAEPLAGPTVVVTHHAPHRGSLAQRYADDWASSAFVTELPDAFFDVPVLWLHASAVRLRSPLLPGRVQPARLREPERQDREQGVQAGLGHRPPAACSY
ncbi:hypothetical protein [Variovorax sp. VRV01]|uniref:hypothetical protein n=1 Tax=Variovorax sp. VRV01 TaxID=2769259 RepID=UPI001CE02F58|nr:hypothetical protein [Variovorax sp. VRV01]